jgi:hypothetical protein
VRKTVGQVIREVAEQRGVHIRDILGPSRMRRFAWPRQEAMFEAYVQCPHASYPAIGRILGDRDHTTILHGVRAHCERSGIDYDRIRRVFQKDHNGITRPVPTSASDYREIVRLHVQ